MKLLPLVTAAMSLSATLLASSTAFAQSLNAEPVHNVVLVHGAWVDGSGWKPVYDILTKDGYHVSIVQEPLTSLADDVTATKRVLGLQDGATILVGHSYGGSVITEAGEDSHVVGLVYVAAHAPAVGEDESDLGKRMPSVTAKQDGAVQTTSDGYTYLNPADFPQDFAADLPQQQARFEARSQILTAAQVFTAPLTAAAWTIKPSWAIVAGADKVINPDLERWYYTRAHSHTTVLEGASHSVYESRPEEVAAVIEDAAEHAVQ
ncbi:alpha/beta hydrolase [Paraburkholderia caribensis]|uniref:alpha/beta hydrolase n=1 Tax=Paraburkholderia caribensis TaxID=75105 RepID=UPI000720D2B4|nr:alpha/beta hydrolase [Paraburkholderia caribensis]ALP68539.1 hydrolase [Paraburkholderia caribensis]AUT57896.1 alpha/beta hydrolase [Paraburkholderia caribensis]